MEWFTKLFDLNKIPAKVVTLIWIIVSLLIFLPVSFLQRLQLTAFKGEYGKYFGIIWLVSTGLLVTFIVTWIGNKFQRSNAISKRKREIQENVRKLDHSEKAVLREFFIRGQHTVSMPIDDPVISGLMSKGILYMVSQFGGSSIFGIFMNLSMTDYAREHITSNLLGLPKSPTEEEKYQILQHRPDWAKREERSFGY